MSGFIQGQDRHQALLFPERLDDYIGEDNPVRPADVLLMGSILFPTHHESHL